MNLAQRIRERLVELIALVGVMAAVWSTSMLVGGFRAAGQLDSQWNPLGTSVAFVAAAAIIGSTAIFYYVLGSRRRGSIGLLAITGTIVFILTIFASITQLVMVVDGAAGDRYVKGTEVKIGQAWHQAARIDRTIVNSYLAQVDFYQQRMAEEARSGKGPRFKEAERNYNRLRAQYGSVLGRAEKVAQQGGSLGDDAVGAKAYIDRLINKASVFKRFAAAEGIVAQDFSAQLRSARAALDGIGDDGWIDRKSVVYRNVMAKFGQMIASGGLADLGFTMIATLSVIPDFIQILCTGLLLFLRSKEEEGLEPDAGWSPFDKVWGDSAKEAAE